jgi:lipoprotein-releasing system ATP-binding protein
MSEIPRLRIPQTTASPTSSGGPHFALSAFEEQVHTVEPVLPPRAGAVGSGLNELSAEPESFATAPSAPVELAAVGLKKNYRKGPVEIPVLGGVDLEVGRGEFLAIIGQSGSGKSTLLHLLGTLDAPTSGEVHFDGRRIDNLPAAERDRLRNTMFGMIFQFYHLLPELTTLENVLSPLMIRHGMWNYRRHRREHLLAARELLELVGLSHRLKHRPRELSGGEMQRTAIARALISGPRILLADEPTGNLDVETGQEILRILRTLNRTQNLSIVMVTHDTAIAAEADRTVRLAAGRVERL